MIYGEVIRFTFSFFFLKSSESQLAAYLVTLLALRVGVVVHGGGRDEGVQVADVAAVLRGHQGLDGQPVRADLAEATNENEDEDIVIIISGDEWERDGKPVSLCECERASLSHPRTNIVK